MQKGDAALARFLHRMKAPIWRDVGTHDWDGVLAQQQRAIREAFGFESLEELDREWMAWMKNRDRDDARQSK